MTVNNIRAIHLIQGDLTAPSDFDLILWEGSVNVGEPIPEGWTITTGNRLFSQVFRVAYRDQVKPLGSDLEDLQEIRLEITRINEAAGRTIFNPAATSALNAMIERAE